MRDLRRIVALTDSVGLPRIAEGDHTYWDDVWPQVLERVLREEGVKTEVISCGMRSRTSRDINRLQFREHVIMKRPTALVLQIGVVDCAPRIFPLRVRKALGSSMVPPALRKRVIAVRSKQRAKITSRDPLRYVYVPPALFEREVTLFRDSIADAEAAPFPLVLPILAHDCMDEKSPGFLANVRRYNQILAEVWGDAFVPVSAIFPDGIPRESMSFDGYHLAASGHAAVAKALHARLCR
ncbi:MAG: SGNH/GDSL hydrolase family protein [Myxococcota bacterium]